MKPFSELKQRSQVGRVRRALDEVLARHRLEGASVKLAAHAYNTTFRVTTDTFDAAVRVNVNSKRSFAEVRGEVAFVELVHRSGLVRVPEPLPIFGGKPYDTAEIAGFPTPCPVAAYRWIQGGAPSKSDPASAGKLLGETLRGLHSATEGVVQLPDGAERPVLGDVMDGLPMRLPTGGIFEEVLGRANEALDRLKVEPPQLTHFDLHFGNVKVHEGKMWAYDFDDSLWAWKAADVAQSMFYLRSTTDPDTSEAAFWDGFGTPMKELGISTEDFEMLVAGRALLLANDFLGNVNAYLREIAPRYLRVTEKRLRNMLETGRFEPRSARFEDEA